MGGSWFDEDFDAGGDVRPAYAALRRRARSDPLCPTRAVARQLRERPFGDDTRIFPIPVVIHETEYRAVLRPGLTQRALALQRLFADLVLGGRRILSAGVGPHADLVEDIFAAEGWPLAALRDLWRGHDHDAIRFVYGPDLVRDPSGRWTVLEDNVGCVGGSADAFCVAETYRDVTGLPGCPTCRPESDLAVAVQRWTRERDGRAVAVLGCEAGGTGPWPVRIDENARRHRVLDAIGVPVVDRCHLEPWLTSHGAATTVINFAVDPSWTEIFGHAGVALLNAPGTGVLGNKALLPSMDDLIRFYLDEDPILATPPTRLIADARLPADAADWVVKTAAGCQGTEVFVLAWHTPDRITGLADQLRDDPATTAVAQRYVEPSRLTPSGPGGWDGYRVEIRPVSYVLGRDDVHVAEQPVAKVVADLDARRLNNMSQGACYAPVLREPCATCGTEE